MASRDKTPGRDSDEDLTSKPGTSQDVDEPDLPQPRATSASNLVYRHRDRHRRDSGDWAVREDIVNETNGLYLMHLARQMSELGMELGSQLMNSRFTTTPRHVRSLQTLAERFTESPQRRWVHEQAQNVDLDSLNASTFQQLLNGLFQEGGVTWERVLVLFYFCTDLSIRAIQEKFINNFIQIYNWTTVFFSGRFSYWVQQQGGWGVVLENSVNYATRLTLLGVCCATVLAVCLFLKTKK